MSMLSVNNEPESVSVTLAGRFRRREGGEGRVAVQIALAEGFGYVVDGDTYRDEVSSAWHGARLGIEVRCPSGFDGTFYAHFHDWNTEDRAEALFLSGRDLGPLPQYDANGF